MRFPVKGRQLDKEGCIWAFEDDEEDLEESDTMRNITKQAVQNNKFYIGANSVFDRNWGHKTPEAAIQHARKLMESQGGDEYFVVKIIKVVRRAVAPIKVEDIR